MVADSRPSTHQIHIRLPAATAVKPAIEGRAATTTHASTAPEPSKKAAMRSRSRSMFSWAARLTITTPVTKAMISPLMKPQTKPSRPPPRATAPSATGKPTSRATLLPSTMPLLPSPNAMVVGQTLMNRLVCRIPIKATMKAVWVNFEPYSSNTAVGATRAKPADIPIAAISV